MTHLAYVTAAYAASALVIAALVAWLFLDQRAQRRALADLESRGVHRRSERRRMSP